MTGERRWAGPEALLSDAGTFTPDNTQDAGQKGLAGPPSPASGAPEIPVSLKVGKIAALFEIDPLARLSFEGRNTGLADQSDSGQDLSLMTRAALVGWKAGEMLALLGQARRERGAGEKHPRYYQLTIEKALATAEKQRAEGRVAEEFGLPDGTAVDELETGERLRLISGVLGFDPIISRVTKTLSEPVTYRLYWNDHAVTLGTSANLLDQSAFRARMLDVAGKVIPRMKQERWDSLVQMISDSCEVQEVGEEGNLLGVVFGWLTAYVTEHISGAGTTALGVTPNWQEMARANRPFRSPDGVFISTQRQSGFIAHLRLQHDTRLTTQQIATVLRQLGWEYQARSIRDGQGVFMRGLWRAPADWGKNA